MIYNLDKNMSALYPRVQSLIFDNMDLTTISFMHTHKYDIVCLPHDMRLKVIELIENLKGIWMITLVEIADNNKSQLKPKSSET